MPPSPAIVGAQIVAVDADTGPVIAGTLGGWSCNTVSPLTRLGGSFAIERLPLNHSYNLYAEPLVGLALPADFSFALDSLCSGSVAPTSVNPGVNTNFNIRVLPASP